MGAGDLYLVVETSVCKKSDSGEMHGSLRNTEELEEKAERSMSRERKRRGVR